MSTLDEVRTHALALRTVRRNVVMALVLAVLAVAQAVSSTRTTHVE